MVVALNRRIREFARSNPSVYKAWFLYYRRSKGMKPVLPRRGDALYLDGFPRSGNTYFTAAISAVFPDVIFSNHLHAIAPIKIALRRDVPTIILMREPEAAIASYIVHIYDPRSVSSMSGLNEKDLCLILTSTWLSYYSCVKKLQKRIEIISSEAAFDRPLRAVEKIIESTNLNYGPGLLEEWQIFHDNFQQRDASKAQGSTSFPDKARELQKQAALKILRRQPLLDRCSRLYHELARDCSLAY